MFWSSRQQKRGHAIEVFTVFSKKTSVSRKCLANYNWRECICCFESNLRIRMNIISTLFVSNSMTPIDPCYSISCRSSLLFCFMSQIIIICFVVMNTLRGIGLLFDFGVLCPCFWVLSYKDHVLHGMACEVCFLSREWKLTARFPSPFLHVSFKERNRMRFTFDTTVNGRFKCSKMQVV